MEAINVFLKKEQDYDMFGKNILGIKYWEFMRPLVSCEINTKLSGESEMFSKNNFCLNKYLINIKNINKYFLKRNKYDILIVSNSRRVRFKNKYKNNYIDYYIDYLKSKYKILAIEEPSWSSLGVSKNAHEFPLYTKNIYLTDFHELYFLLRKNLYKYFHMKKYKIIINEYKNIKKIIDSWYSCNDDLINFEKYFIDTIIKLDLDRKYIRKILKILSPKIVMLHYMPSIFREMLVNECNKQKIPTIEIQHGTITKIDPLLNKSLDASKLENDTKYIFSFGKNQINKTFLSIKKLKNVIDVGFPFFEDKLKRLKNKDKKYILIISQSTIGDSIAKFTSELAELLATTKYKIIFKYHPNEITKKYTILNKKNILQIKNEKSIYDIQNESILQIGAYSTSLYEGFAMKVPTLIIKTMFGSIETVDIFKDIKKGVYFIETPNDVLKYINKNDIIPLDSDIKKLWQSNSKEKILKQIEKIIGR